MRAAFAHHQRAARGEAGTDEAQLRLAEHFTAALREMFGEVTRDYVDSVRRAMVEYRLRSSDPSDHMGLTVPLVMMARACDVSTRADPKTVQSAPLRHPLLLTHL